MISPIGHGWDCLCETCMRPRGIDYRADGTFETYTGFTVVDWPYVYTTAAERQSDAPYAFWLGKDGANPLDGTRLWSNS